MFCSFSTVSIFTVSRVNRIANPTTFTAVTGLKYGSTGEMLTVGNKQNTPYYAVGTELTSSNYNTSGSTSIPTASGMNAGTHTIYYYIPAEGNYSEKKGSINVTIEKATPTLELSATSGTVNYNNTNTFPSNSPVAKIDSLISSV